MLQCYFVFFYIYVLEIKSSKTFVTNFCVRRLLVNSSINAEMPLKFQVMHEYAFAL